MVGINGTRNGVRHQPERTGLVTLALVTLIAVLPGTATAVAEDKSQSASANVSLQLVIPDSLTVQGVSQTIPLEGDAGNLQTATIHSVLLEWRLRSGTPLFVRPTLRTAEQTYAVLPVPGFLRLDDLPTAAALRAFAPERDLPATLLGAAADSLEKPRGRAAIIFGSEPSAQNGPAVLTIAFAAFSAPLQPSRYPRPCLTIACRCRGPHPYGIIPCVRADAQSRSRGGRGTPPLPAGLARRLLHAPLHRQRRL